MNLSTPLLEPSKLLAIAAIHSWIPTSRSRVVVLTWPPITCAADAYQEVGRARWQQWQYGVTTPAGASHWLHQDMCTIPSSLLSQRSPLYLPISSSNMVYERSGENTATLNTTGNIAPGFKLLLLRICDNLHLGHPGWGKKA